MNEADFLTRALERLERVGAAHLAACSRCEPPHVCAYGDRLVEAFKRYADRAVVAFQLDAADVDLSPFPVAPVAGGPRGLTGVRARYVHFENHVAACKKCGLFFAWCAKGQLLYDAYVRETPSKGRT